MPTGCAHRKVQPTRWLPTGYMFMEARPCEGLAPCGPQGRMDVCAEDPSRQGRREGASRRCADGALVEQVRRGA
jgi:hypothetical protein